MLPTIVLKKLVDHQRDKCKWRWRVQWQSKSRALYDMKANLLCTFITLYFMLRDGFIHRIILVFRVSTFIFLRYVNSEKVKQTLLRSNGRWRENSRALCFCNCLFSTAYCHVCNITRTNFVKMQHYAHEFLRYSCLLIGYRMGSCLRCSVLSYNMLLAILYYFI